DYFRLVREHKRLDTKGLPPIRIAVLAEFASQSYCQILRVLMAHAGWGAQIYEAEYGAIEVEALDAQSGLYAFAPEIVLVLPTTNALRFRYLQSADARESFAEREAQRFVDVWTAIGSRAQIIQGNWAPPYERQLGSFDWKVPTSLYAQVHRLNEAIAERARAATVLVDDISAVAQHVGLATWCDEKLWTMAKALCSLEHLPRVVASAVDVVLATRGRGIKCVVCDLDNTLWGGVVGDDGLEGIRIGPTGEGEAFFRLQLYLRELRRRGVLLAVASKNDPELARRVFREHPEMVLREEDIAVFMVSWDPKPDSLRAIKETLGIGFDAIAFLDDNPFERNMVRQYLPDVVVPELPEEPSDYVRAIADANLFEASAYTAEDVARTALYQEEAKRKVLARSFTNVDEYLRSLEMKITIAPFDAFHLPRIAQLIQRSNQFNLTTRRWTEAECEALMKKGGGTHPLYVRLSDRFGDHGLVSVVVVEIDGATANIPAWLMSCRVLSRGVEEHVMNHVVALAKANGAARVVGEYLPTAKNGMVKDFYARFGFTPEGDTRWTLDVDAYEPRPTFLA
ncbi:MAG TPA: HAD-IIIC family phosphatase, partial [Labilithrix sp.]